LAFNSLEIRAKYRTSLLLSCHQLLQVKDLFLLKQPAHKFRSSQHIVAISVMTRKIAKSVSNGWSALCHKITGNINQSTNAGMAHLTKKMMIFMLRRRISLVAHRRAIPHFRSFCLRKEVCDGLLRSKALTPLLPPN
jgi:hypothetical protein